MRLAWRVTGLLAALLALAACEPATQTTAQDAIPSFVTAVQDAVACRAAAAEKPEYRLLNRRMPLADIGTASLWQMTDPQFAAGPEVVAIAAWIRDLNVCRERLLRVADSTLPSFVPILEEGRDNDDDAMVKLAERKLTWGQAVMRLKANRTKLRADLVARGDQILAQIAQAQQAQLSRRTSILSSVIRILP